MSLLARWFATAQPDGTAEAVTGMAAEAAAPIRAEPAALPQAGGAMVREAMMAKLLHGWLENRHQTMFPLAMDVRTLSPDQRDTLVQAAAVFLLAGPAGDAVTPHASRLRGWLREANADAAMLAALDAALTSPWALNLVIDSVLAQSLAPYAYVAAVLALDARDAANAGLLEYLAIRLLLPATLVRSAQRRYGGSLE